VEYCDGYWLVLHRVPQEGYWEGFVGISDSDHPLRYNFVGHMNDLHRLDVHGGVTFSNASLYSSRSAIYSYWSWQPLPTWWIGFDCGHSGDLMPLYSYDTGAKVYRNFEFAGDELWRLFRQIKKRATPKPHSIPAVPYMVHMAKPPTPPPVLRPKRKIILEGPL